MNFQCAPFEPNLKILKDFSKNVFALLDYLWSKLHPRSNNNWGNKSQKKKTNKGPFHGYKKLGKFLISQPHMLYKWNLSQIYVLIRSFIWQNLGV